MTSFSRMKVTLLIVLFPLTALGAEISVGGTSLRIPTPSGFAEVTPGMMPLYEFQKRFVAPSNEEFVVFISENEVPKALNGEIPELIRRFSVQTVKTLIDASATTSDFEELKTLIKTQNEEILKNAQGQMDSTIDDISDGIDEDFDIDLALKMSQMVPLPPHAETERSLAYSSFVRYDMKDEFGNPMPFTAVVTATFVYVKGKVLFLYSYAEESALDWSRAVSSEWATNVVKSNPSDLKSSIKETLPSAVTGIDWGQVGAKAVGGAIIGLLIALIGWAINRGKAS